MSAPPPRQNGIAAAAATSCAPRLPPSSRAIKPVRITARASATAAKKRKPVSEVPKRISERWPKKGGTGELLRKMRGKNPRLRPEFLLFADSLVALGGFLAARQRLSKDRHKNRFVIPKGEILLRIPAYQSIPVGLHFISK